MPFAPKNLPRPARRAGRPANPSTTARGYGWAHQQHRARLIKERPICERCKGGWSAHLHHIDRNPFNRDNANALMLCERCHEQEHGR